MKIPESLAAILPRPWDEMNEIEKRFSVTFIAYAAGDAFGAFYEFANTNAEVKNELRAKENWPLGGTSDDTSLTVLTFLSLSENNPEKAAKRFMELLSNNKDSLRGLGPTTRKALGLPVKEWELNSVGLTNGAMMRTALFGLVFKKEDEREIWVRALSSCTHRDEAVIASNLIADIFSGNRPDLPSSWAPSHKGVSNDAMETLWAVIYVSERAKTIAEGLMLSCSLGGDTDTVAALSGSLLASRSSDLSEVFKLPWLAQVDWSGILHAKEALQIAFERMALA